MAKRRLLNSKINLEDKYRKGTRLRQARDKAEKEAFLNSPEGKAAVMRLSAANDLSAILATQVIEKHKERRDELSELSQSLVDKMNFK